MPRFLDTTIRVRRDDTEPGVFWVGVGVEERRVDLEDLKARARAERDSWDTLIDNMAIRLAVSSVDLNDETAVLAELAGARFRFPR